MSKNYDRSVPHPQKGRCDLAVAFSEIILRKKSLRRELRSLKLWDWGPASAPRAGGAGATGRGPSSFPILLPHQADHRGPSVPGSPPRSHSLSSWSTSPHRSNGPIKVNLAAAKIQGETGPAGHQRDPEAPQSSSEALRAHAGRWQGRPSSQAGQARSLLRTRRGQCAHEEGKPAVPLGWDVQDILVRRPTRSQETRSCQTPESPPSLHHSHLYTNVLPGSRRNGEPSSSTHAQESIGPGDGGLRSPKVCKRASNWSQLKSMLAHF